MYRSLEPPIKNGVNAALVAADGANIGTKTVVTTSHKNNENVPVNVAGLFMWG